MLAGDIGEQLNVRNIAGIQVARKIGVLIDQRDVEESIANRDIDNSWLPEI